MRDECLHGTLEQLGQAAVFGGQIGQRPEHGRARRARRLDEARVAPLCQHQEARQVLALALHYEPRERPGLRRATARAFVAGEQLLALAGITRDVRVEQQGGQVELRRSLERILVIEDAQPVARVDHEVVALVVAQTERGRQL